MLKFSLILCTIHRSREVESFLDSVAIQNYPYLELIVVDQNADGKLDPLLRKFSDRIPIVHLHSEPGLSRARNVGLKRVRDDADIVAFPDDDCLYREGLLGAVDEWFREHPEQAGLCGELRDIVEHPNFTPPPPVETSIDRYNVFKLAISATAFLRAAWVRQLPGFDEGLGVGCPTIYQSGEESDYLLNALEKRAKIRYDNRFTVFHPNFVPDYSAPIVLRAYRYGCGLGFVLKRHRYPWWWTGKYLVRPLVAACFSALSGNVPKARYYINSLRGRWRGLRNGA